VISSPNPPIRLHPQNPKIFEFRGKPLVLVTATEHYGAVLNRPFRFERYVADAADKSQTLTRLFLLFREFQSACNPYSTCKPESTDYVAPFLRTGPGQASDGLPKYDLTRWNPEFFDRLHRFMALTSERGIVVEAVLLSNTYADQMWAVNPLNSVNNVNEVETIPWADYMTRRHAKLFAWQCAHVRKMVEELNRYDNVLFEVCNEPGGAVAIPHAPTVDEVNDWLCALARLIRETEAELPCRHLLAGQEAFAYSHTLPEKGAVQQLSERSFRDFPVDVVNMHPLPNMTYRGRVYDLGQFMSAELHLQELRRYCLDAYRERKPLNLDEDNAATRFRDENGWTIHRKRAWTTLFCGAHYDMIDFSILPWLETGTPDSQRFLRTWMQHLSEYVKSIDVIRARPLESFLTAQPAGTVGSALAVEGEEYHIYLADGREFSDPGAGGPVVGKIGFRLPEGGYRVTCFSPATGESSTPTELRGGADVTLPLKPFTHDVVVCIDKNR
jgi:hypothetical protein